jgi:hypothetical protein
VRSGLVLEAGLDSFRSGFYGLIYFLGLEQPSVLP